MGKTVEPAFEIIKRQGIPGERLTAEEFETLVEDHGLELIDGIVTETEMDQLAAWVAMRINALLWTFIEQHKLGAYYSSDVAYKCFDGENYRKPDGSFVSIARQPNGPARGPMTIPPDLAVEVVSPSDRFLDVIDKAKLYQAVGVKRTWIIEPTTRQVWIYSVGDQPTVLKPGDTLSEPELLPGFSMNVADLFPPAPKAAPTA